MSTINTIFLSLGSNIEPREHYLLKAMELLRQKTGKIVEFSAIYESVSWGFSSKTSFLNNVVCMESSFSPSQLLNTCQDIEKIVGRNKKGKPYADRKIDIDILFYNEEIIATQNLQIPHPFLAARRFVLEPFAEIAPGLIHPVLNKTIKQLLSECTDNLPVTRINRTNYAV